MGSEEAPIAEKAYCCGNSSQRESLLISKFDLILSLIFFIVFTVFLSILVGNPDTFSDIAKNSPGNATTDLAAFLEWPKGSQIGVLSSLVLLHIFYIGLAILLFVAAYKRLHKILLIWFVTTMITYTAGFIIFIVTVIYLHDKIAISIGLITVFLYKWYSLWIVKILMREITSVSESADVYGDPIENGESDMADSSGIPLDKF